jgi:uncharacterized membrane protein required for colicin V production
MNWIDIAIVVLLCIGTISGAARGFVASITSVACMIVSIMVAKTYYKALALFLILNTPLKETLTKFMIEKKVLNGLNAFLPGGTMTAFYSNNFEKDINTFLSIALINLISIIAIYMAVRFLLFIVEGYVKGAAELPVLNEINRLGGGAIGLLKTVLILLLIFAAVVPISNALPWQGLREALQSSALAKYLYSYNFILGWIWNTALDLIKK